MLEPIRLTSLANEAFDRVVAAITSGEFEPGEKLSESRLARELGVSRGPIREALQRLEGKLVQRVPHIGVQVIEFGADELMQLFYLREALEGMAARLAAEKADKAWAVAAERMLEQHAAELRDSGGRSYRQRAVDNDFHFSIAKASGCANIERLLLNEVNYQLRIARLKSSMRPGRAEEALKQHYEIFEAIAGGNPDRAEAAMRNHISSARVGSMASLATGEAPSKAEAG